MICNNLIKIPEDADRKLVNKMTIKKIFIKKKSMIYENLIREMN